MISVITATYNRVDKLPKLYNSLLTNYKTYKDFEWVIADDGSNDETDKLVKTWIKESPFKIVYNYQDNQGKMAAINDVMEKASGDIIMEVDSDDAVVDGALKRIAVDYKKLNNDKVYGILYKRILGNKDTSVDKSISNKVMTLFDIHNKYGYSFDMNLTFKAEARKKYHYEVVNHEKFITEASLYYRMDQDYDGMLFIDDYIVEGEYYDDGYSKNEIKLFKKYPFGYLSYFKQCLSYINKDTLKNRKMYFIKHYILFSYLTKTSMIKCIKDAPSNKGLITLLVIPGYIKSKML